MGSKIPAPRLERKLGLSCFVKAEEQDTACFAVLALDKMNHLFLLSSFLGQTNHSTFAHIVSNKPGI